MREPVQTPSGISYEKALLEEFWATPACSDGRKDPITKEPIGKSVVCPRNRALEAHISHFLEENPRAASISLESCTDFAAIKFRI